MRCITNYYCHMPTTDYAAQTVVVGNFTATPVARVTVNEFAAGSAGAFKLQARPHCIEVVKAGGERTSIEIVDQQARILAYIRTAVLLISIISLIIRGVRAMKKRSSK